MTRAILEFEDCASATSSLPTLRTAVEVLHEPQCLPFVIVEGDRRAILRAGKLPGVVELTWDEMTTASFCTFRGNGQITTSDLRLLIKSSRQWQGYGVTVAVLDSGIDTSHPVLNGKVKGFFDVTGQGPAGDLVGHGTAVASIIAGDLVEGTSYGTLEGLAPGAELISVKVFDSKGNGSIGTLVAGLDVAAANGADIINYSGGGWGKLNGPEERAVNALASINILTVAAAGNEGKGRVNTPGTAPGSICVGALNYCGELAKWSNRGSPYTDLQKPDVVAPGEAIVGAASGWMDGRWDGVRTSYDVFTGTSFAVPQVTAALAQCMEIMGRRMSREEAEELLAIGKQKKSSQVGWGLLDVESMQKAVIARVSAQ